MVQRLTYRKRHSYATKSNQTRVVKTPGGKLVYQYTKKRASGPKCPVTGKKIQGIPHLRPAEYKRSRLSRNRRTVNRPYGGVLSGTAVRERIIRAFLSLLAVLLFLYTLAYLFLSFQMIDDIAGVLEEYLDYKRQHNDKLLDVVNQIDQQAEGCNKKEEYCIGKCVRMAAAMGYSSCFFFDQIIT
ncbi:hypothetical protein ACJX0J_031355, partial [Zea mays]